jgi:hypothetical protein
MGTLGGIASSWDEECDEQMLERLHLLCDTAQGLEALHANHVVHGDVVGTAQQLLLHEHMCTGSPVRLVCCTSACLHGYFAAGGLHCW